MSPQTRGKLRAANLGRKRSLETRAKLSAMRKGKKWTAEMHERRREYIENKKIKSDIIDFIVKSNELSEFSLVQNALLLLFENTGCQEDFEIFQCESCSFIFTRALESEENIGRYYKSEEYISVANLFFGFCNSSMSGR